MWQDIFFFFKKTTHCDSSSQVCLRRPVMVTPNLHTSVFTLFLFTSLLTQEQVCHFFLPNFPEASTYIKYCMVDKLSCKADCPKTRTSLFKQSTHVCLILLEHLQQALRSVGEIKMYKATRKCQAFFSFLSKFRPS